MSQKLLTEDIRKKIPPLYSQENVKDPIVHVKFFTPWTQWTWYATEFDGKDIFFGWVVGLEKELGYFSLSEMESVRGPGGLMIERDMYFKPKPLSEVMADHGERLLPQVRKPQNESKKRPLYPHVPKNRQPQFPHTSQPQSPALPCPICLSGKQQPRFSEEGLRYHLSEFHKRVDVDELVKLAKELASGGPLSRLPLTKDIGEPVPPQYRHLVGLVSEPLPKEAY